MNEDGGEPGPNDAPYGIVLLALVGTYAILMFVFLVDCMNQ